MKSVDERIEVTAEFLSSPLISQSGRNTIIKSLIKDICEELELTSEQRTKLSELLGE